MKNIAFFLSLLLGIEPCYPSGNITTIPGAGAITITAVGYSQDNGITKSPGTLANDSTVGSLDWNTPSNSAAQDNVYSSYMGDGSGIISHYLKATNFGFSIPNGITIGGIKVEVDKYSTLSGGGDHLTDYRVRLVKGGVIGSTDKASGSDWASSDTNSYTVYGGSSDLWGDTWTAADINASNFGFVIASSNSCSICTSPTVDDVFIDHIRVTVYAPVSGRTISINR